MQIPSTSYDLPYLLETAIALATRAHHGQRDKAGAPYILHPLRVMMRLREPEARIVAVLHDVLEDKPLFADEVRSILPPELLSTLLNVTKQEDEHGEECYMHFIERAAADPLARLVKIADLEDNLDTTRLGLLAPMDLERMNRYLAALARLREIERQSRKDYR